jgi:gamma-glutamyltranspeptidase / glutathione hydrolase
MNTQLTANRRQTGARLAACLFTGLLIASEVGRGQVMAVNGMVVSSHPMATEAGRRILQQGGNAFDAAVAVAATLAVVEPLMSGLGGVGGYALVYDSKKHAIRSLDFIGTAPANTKPGVFTAGARLWDRAHPARDSFASPVVPGSLSGWAALHDQYGTMSWPQLLAPAIEYADQGFVVTPAVKEGFEAADFGAAVGRYPYGAGIFFNDGKPWPVADVLKQPNLAATLRSIAAGGPAVFYGGSLATRFAEFFQANGGLLTVKDFADYHARWQDPLHITYRDYDVYSQPPGGSGMTVLQTLNILEQFDLRTREHNSPAFVHLVAEAMKLAFVDEDAFNTGKSYAKIPLDRLLSKAYAKQQAARIDLDRPQVYEPAKRPVPSSPAFQHTTNHTVVDRDHNVVVITQTLMLPAGVVVPETGVIFNNGMSYFSVDPQDINYIEAGQRPRFVMSPTIVTNHGQPYFALGSAGGWTIPQTIVQVAVRALDYRMDAHEAVKAPRFVLQYLGNSIPYFPGTDLRLEKGFSEQTRSGLVVKGHRLLDQEGWLGMLNGIMIYPRTGALSAGADARREGHAAGW